MPTAAAALSILQSRGNARRAVELARRAVELNAKWAEARVTLARALYLSGLATSGDAELKRAEELAPKDSKVKELVAKARNEAKELKVG